MDNLKEMINKAYDDVAANYKGNKKNVSLEVLNRFICTDEIQAVIKKALCYEAYKEGIKKDKELILVLEDLEDIIQKTMNCEIVSKEELGEEIKKRV